MKYAHCIRLRVFVNENEDISNIKNRLTELISSDIEKEKIKIYMQDVKGVLNNKIIILNVNIEKDRNIKAFLDNLLNRLGSEQKRIILDETEKRTYDDGRFFLRLDKDRLLDGEYVLTDSGNCIHIEMHIAAYPMNKESAVNVVRKIFA